MSQLDGGSIDFLFETIEQLSLVAEATETDAAGTDREARRLLDLAKQIGDLTSRFVCWGNPISD